MRPLLLLFYRISRLSKNSDILAQLCTQHKETYQTGLDIIKFIQKSLDTTTKNYSLIITSYAYENVIQHFKKEKDLVSLRLLNNIIVNHILHNNALLYDDLAIECIEYTLENAVLSHEDNTRLHTICGEFYYTQSKKISCPSLTKEHICNAIKHNHTKAIFEKASLYCNATYIKQNIHSQELTELGLVELGKKMPFQLSGGEQQKLVIARALLNNPPLLLADEPTGNLDPETSDDILRLLIRINREHNTAVLISTHNYQLIDKYPARIYSCGNNSVQLEKGIYVKL